MFQKVNKHFLLNFLTILFLLALPYYLFQGKLFIGGDDTRLMYAYPLEYFRNTVLFSWSNFSAVGSNTATQLMAPFLLMWSALAQIINSKPVLDYLAFSSPLIINFVFFQKFFRELISDKKRTPEIFAGALFLILSPILIINQLFIFLTTIWFLGLTFILMYYFLRFLKESNFSDIFKGMLWTTFLSLSFFSIPWILGLMFPLFVGMGLVAIKLPREHILQFMKKFVVFFSFIMLSQSFWLISLIMSLVQIDLNSPTGKIIHPGYISTFITTINSTAVGTIFYPMLDLFHRQIAFNFAWKLSDVFASFYDKTIVLNLIFAIILLLGLANYKKYLKKWDKIIFLLFSIPFVLTLFLFTVNIGPFRDLFIMFGKIPGFVMFRNFYDKFAPAYVIFYSILITLCLIVINKMFPKWSKQITIGFIIVVLINFIPVKPTVNSALWTTQSIYKNIDIPSEYLDTMEFIKNNVSSTNTILSYPFGTSLYTVVKEIGSNNVYLGTSPVKIFSGVNDISGFLSFNFNREATDAYEDLLNNDAKSFNNLLYSHNINYILVTKNIPSEVKKSWVYDANMLKVQNDDFLSRIADKKIYTSSEGNYELYQAKSKNQLIKSSSISFQKINQTKYKILVRNISKPQKLNFYDSYNSGWKLFVKPSKEKLNCIKLNEDLETKSTECKEDFEIIEGEELSYLWENPVYDNTHKMVDDFSNQWVIDPDLVRKTFDKSQYKVNEDGSLDFNLVMYFRPQLYFYYGVIVSAIVLGASGFYLAYRKVKRVKTKKKVK